MVRTIHPASRPGNVVSYVNKGLVTSPRELEGSGFVVTWFIQGGSGIHVPYHSPEPVLSLLLLVLSPFVLAAAEAKLDANGEGIASKLQAERSFRMSRVCYSRSSRKSSTKCGILAREFSMVGESRVRLDDEGEIREYGWFYRWENCMRLVARCRWVVTVGRK